MGVFSCATFTQPKNPVEQYEKYIIDWQKRIKRDGWSENLIDEIVRSCISVMSYSSEFEKGDDYWATPKEIKANGMKGDCEDFGVMMMASLKMLNYPYRVRLQAIRTPMTDHAMLNTELPNGRWKRYNTTPVPGGEFDIALSIILFEWDEDNIYIK